MTESEEVQLIVDITPGLQNGEVISVEQMANELPGHISGDLVFRIKEERSQEVLMRRGRLNHNENPHDLYMNMRLRLVDSLTGFSTTVAHLDGHPIEVNREGKVTPCGFVMRIPGEGMPIPHSEGQQEGEGRHKRRIVKRDSKTGQKKEEEVSSLLYGDMVVTFEIKFPETLKGSVQTELRSLLGGV